MTDIDYIKGLKKKLKEAQNKEKLEKEKKELEQKLFETTSKGKALAFGKKLFKKLSK